MQYVVLTIMRTKLKMSAFETHLLERLEIVVKTAKIMGGGYRSPRSQTDSPTLRDTRG